MFIVGNYVKVRFENGGLGWTLKINCLSSPDRPNSGGADSKYFIEPLNLWKQYFIEYVCYFPQQKTKRKGAWFKVFVVFSLSPLMKHFECNICSSFKDYKVYESISLNMF